MTRRMRATLAPWMSAAALRAIGGYSAGLDILKTYASDPQAAQQQFAKQWATWWRNRSGEPEGAEPWVAMTRAAAERLPVRE